jgi:hypothetical protein
MNWKVWFLVGALAVNAWAVDNKQLFGRDLVEANNLGNVLSTGEVLLFGSSGPNYGNAYPYLSSPDTIKVYGGAVADSGWVVVDGLDAAYAAKRDSVQIRGITGATLSGTWAAVNYAEFHDDELLVGAISIYPRTGSYADTSKVLGVILPGHNQTFMAQTTVPANKSLTPTQARISWAMTSTAEKFSRLPVVVTLKYKPLGQNWRIWDQFELTTGDAQPIFVPFSKDETLTKFIPGKAAFDVSVGVSAASWIPALVATVRVDYELK